MAAWNSSSGLRERRISASGDDRRCVNMVVKKRRYFLGDALEAGVEFWVALDERGWKLKHWQHVRRILCGGKVINLLADWILIGRLIVGSGERGRSQRTSDLEQNLCRF